MDVIAVVDPVVSQVSPRMFNKQLATHFSEIFDHIKKKDVYSSFFVCGDATKNIEPMCHTNPDSIFVDENIDMMAAKAITDNHGIIIGGNIPLTALMLYGTQQDNMKYVVDMIHNLGTDKLMIAPGCDMPYDVPPDNPVGVAQAVHEAEKVRAVLKNYQMSEIEADIELPQYDTLDHLLIEVFTIDSDTCAACGYMKNMAFSALEHDEFKDDIKIVEYKWTEKENIARAKILNLKHLPSILFNGKLMYSSIIPSSEEYFGDIRRYLSEIHHGTLNN